MKNKILFVGYGEPDPCSRYRIEQFYKKIFDGNENRLRYFRIYPQNKFINNPPEKKHYFEILSRKIISLFMAVNYDVVFLQRNPINFFSPYYEIIIKHILRKKIIFDFDDSLWSMTGKYDSRFETIIKISDLVIAGNKYLYDYAVRFNKNTKVLNTVIDTDLHRKRKPLLDKEPINICWIGSKPGNEYLQEYEDFFIKSKIKFGNRINYIIVSNAVPKFKQFKNYEFHKWSNSTEYDTLQKSHIGLMPLTNTNITKGKCGFKLIQYGAYSLALVASPVGINQEIVRPGINGFLPKNNKEWGDAITKLVTDTKLLRKMQSEARETIVKKFSLHSQLNAFTSLLHSVSINSKYYSVAT